MKVLIFSWRGPGHPNAGGAEISTHEHAKGWVKAGCDVTLFTSWYIGAKKEEVIDGVKIIRRGDQVLGVHWQALRWYLFENHLKYNLVIDQFHGIPFFTPLYVRTKKLGFIHEVAKEVWKLNPLIWPLNLMPAILGFYFESLIFKLLYRNIPFMTVSESTKEDLQDWGIPKQNITVIHNGIVLPKATKNYPKEKKKTVIFMGAISRDKGIEEAIKAFSGISRSIYNCQFWIVGKADSKYLEKLYLLIKSFEITDKIKFWGFVSEQKKFELLSRAHVLVNTSVREGWGLVVMEAAFVGTPSVGYNVPGLRDSIIDNKTGLLCEPNPIDCANKIKYIFDNKSVDKLLSENCVKWSRKFTWEIASKKSLDLIQNFA